MGTGQDRYLKTKYLDEMTPEERALVCKEANDAALRLASVSYRLSAVEDLPVVLQMLGVREMVQEHRIAQKKTL